MRPTLWAALVASIAAPSSATPAPPLIERGIMLQGLPGVPPWRCRRRRGVRVYWPVAANGVQLTNRLRGTEAEARAAEQAADNGREHSSRTRGQPGRRASSSRGRRSPGASFRPITQLELRALGVRPRGRERRQLGPWPPEPPAPHPVDGDKLARALRRLCPRTVPAEDVRRYAALIVKETARCGGEPFVLGALIYHFSQCDARYANSYGVGLTGLNYGMYRRGVRNGQYHYWVYTRGGWEPRAIRLGRYPYTRQALRRAESNLYFAARFLRMHRDQETTARTLCGARPHRHYVSRFIWGDHVRSTSPEDMVLTARRRLLLYYHDERLGVLKRYAGVALGCPLDGCPRRVTSPPGEARAGGRRRHSGVDLLSWWGEPVRAVADGEVVFAGVDLGPSGLKNWDAQRVGLLRRSVLGPRGLFVQLMHAGALRSEYMHLSSYVVRKGQTVHRGDLLGYVGRTGMRVSDEHLHLGLFSKGVMLDPVEVFAPYLIAATPKPARSASAPQRARR